MKYAILITIFFLAAVGSHGYYLDTHPTPYTEVSVKPPFSKSAITEPVPAEEESTIDELNQLSAEYATCRTLMLQWYFALGESICKRAFGIPTDLSPAVEPTPQIDICNIGKGCFDL